MRQPSRSRSCTRAFSAASSARSAAIAPARRPRDHSMEPASTPPPDATPQPVAEPLTRAAIFLVLTVHQGAAHLQAVREFCPELGNLVRALGFRDRGGRLACTLGIGSDLWDRLFGA